MSADVPASSSSSTTAALERRIRQIVRGDESDAELDQLVAELLAREALEDGSTTNAAPQQRINKRFLHNILRSTEGQNRRERSERERRNEERTRQGRQGDDRRTGRMHGWDDDEVKEDNKLLGKEDERRTALQRPSESKMDKYFDARYDPRLDVGSSKAVESDDDARWESVLDVVREKEAKREERREERRRREEEKEKRKARRRSESPSRRRQRRRRGEEKEPRGGSRDGEEEERRNNGRDAALMDARYTKRGEVRDWDKGKS